MIELEDANADPDDPGGCGARALRLQRQSGGQSLVALPRRGCRGLQSLRSHQLRTEPNWDRRRRPLKSWPAGGAGRVPGFLVAEGPTSRPPQRPPVGQSVGPARLIIGNSLRHGVNIYLLGAGEGTDTTTYRRRLTHRTLGPLTMGIRFYIISNAGRMGRPAVEAEVMLVPPQKARGRASINAASRIGWLIPTLAPAPQARSGQPSVPQAIPHARQIDRARGFHIEGIEQPFLRASNSLSYVVSLLSSYGIQTMAKDKDHVTTFTVDPRTADAIDHLKESFGVKTTASVLRKAIALAQIAARNSDETGIITFDGPKGKQQVSLVG